MASAADRDFTARMTRALTERMFPVPPIARADASKCWTLRVESANRAGRVYDIVVGKTQMRCSCPDFQRRRSVCKHILFTLARVARMHTTHRAEMVEYTRALAAASASVPDALWDLIDKQLMEAMWFHLRGEDGADAAAAAAAAAATATADATEEKEETAQTPTCCICCEDLGQERTVTCVTASAPCGGRPHLLSCPPPCKLVLHFRCAEFWNVRGHACPVCRHRWRGSDQWHVRLPTEEELAALDKAAEARMMKDTFRRFCDGKADIIGLDDAADAADAADVDGNSGNDAHKSPLTLFDTLFERARRGEDSEAIIDAFDRTVLQPFRWHHGRHARWIEPAEQRLVLRAARRSNDPEITIEAAIALACDAATSGAEVDNHAHARPTVAAHHQGHSEVAAALDTATLATVGVPSSVHDTLEPKPKKKKAARAPHHSRKRKAKPPSPSSAATSRLSAGRKRRDAARRRINDAAIADNAAAFSEELRERDAKQQAARRANNVAEVSRVLQDATSTLLS